MLGRIAGRGFARALDVGCGEGRFCRILKAAGIFAMGIDPTERFSLKRDDVIPPATTGGARLSTLRSNPLCGRSRRLTP
jgi:hypothetical protein